MKTWTPPFPPTELSPRFSETGGEEGGRVPPKLMDPGFLTSAAEWELKLNLIWYFFLKVENRGMLDSECHGKIYASFNK